MVIVNKTRTLKVIDKLKQTHQLHAMRRESDLMYLTMTLNRWI